METVSAHAPRRRNRGNGCWERFIVSSPTFSIRCRPWPNSGVARATRPGPAPAPTMQLASSVVA
ncbi:hypothetical protein PVAP13_1NG251457 [Panicum virgatum]|uniref:Uncharacterized protein n=1 Tax=Panicum virgatum TaxID=38727 RepID=A0A8T0WXX0_PANVG|nr:hypothetical protein PVAP13_1NG251457 [Panicum virgatum]